MSTFRALFQGFGRLYRRVFQQRLDPQTREIAEILHSVPALRSLSTGSVYEMAAATHRRTYERGKALYYEDDPGLGLYVIESGRIRLFSDADPEQSRQLCELAPPDMFGVPSILGDVRRLETAETITEARLLGFFRPDLKNVLRRSPKAGSEIVMALARHVAGRHERIFHCLEARGGRDVALDVYAEVMDEEPAEASSV